MRLLNFRKEVIVPLVVHFFFRVESAASDELLAAQEFSFSFRCKVVLLVDVHLRWAIPLVWAMV